mmetsp:Transcript_19577/g.29727  ORF Transcript_19577/g.29727 Transcript_19577/m.29727 type:complete len:137 (-) Transcript_19577:169-579(-)
MNYVATKVRPADLLCASRTVGNAIVKTCNRNRSLLPLGNASRLLSSDSDSTSSPSSWRKDQLNKLKDKFEEPLEIDDYEEVQDMWKQMESRVTRRPVRSVEEAKGKTGRRNVRQTDEEQWLQAGLYDGKGPSDRGA